MSFSIKFSARFKNYITAVFKKIVHFKIEIILNNIEVTKGFAANIDKDIVLIGTLNKSKFMGKVQKQMIIDKIIVKE